ncbi:MAG: hypothetical protein HOI47_31075 [Candidatus Scalindua sp.]|jgi:hypothetical protein|nr:hypothetical protein [Candidatus Scalindua sp.]
MDNNGEKINQAIEILIKTYAEINQLKTEFESLLYDYEQTKSMQFLEEYSTGGKSLNLRANHTYLFGRELDPEGPKQEQSYIALICVFYESGGLNRISLKDDTELWIAKVDIMGRKEVCRTWDISSILNITERESYKINELNIGGTVYEYGFNKKGTNNVEEVWAAKFIGYPLVDIKDKMFIEEKILDKLLERKTKEVY